MSWWTDRHFFLLAVIAYGVSAVYSLFLWRKGFREHDRINYAVLLAGLLLQTKAMFMRGLSLKECPVHNLYEAMTFVDWTIVAVYLVLGLLPRLRYLGAFASPIVAAIGVFALMPGLDPAHTGQPLLAANALVSLHAALTLLSYGAFGLSSVAGVMYLTQEHDLKFHKLRAVFAVMPPIDRLEKITNRLLWAGLVLLTAGLALIPFLPKIQPDLHAGTDPKIIWSALVWGLYGALLILHGRFAQSGRKFAWGAVAGFAFVVLTFWGVNLLSPSHRF
ncbi:MAG TPA: cytochrome c biogenesis protein CcsA [Verrucomicrobiae bacterium]|nr:cytochrome c biogenesis protein CcsA [Verrucomicrobiae bacterium]